MTTFGELKTSTDNLYLQNEETKLRPDADKYSDIGTLQSIFAGVG